MLPQLFCAHTDFCGGEVTIASLDQVMGGATGAQVAAAKPAAKKPTAKEIHEE